MIKKVLVVDDDQEMLLSLKEGLEKYNESFSVLMAGDGLIAIKKIEADTICLVVTDLKMPQMDGLALLAHIMEHYPDIPVIIMTGYSTPEMQRMAQEGGAVGYIEKPFMIEDLARKILATMRRETEGGTLHGVSSGMFLQLVQMEQKTCTIRLVDKSSENQGVLFFRDGELLDARVSGLTGLAAAYRLFSWDEVSLSIQNVCPQKVKKIQTDLQAVVLEAMRLKDEAAQKKEVQISLQAKQKAKKAPEKVKAETLNSIQMIQSKLEQEFLQKWRADDIYWDNSWEGLIRQMERIGAFFEAGKLKVGYIDRGESHDFILVPSKEITVVSVDPKCPRDKILKVLSE